MFEYKSVEELVKIAVAGGGFTVNAGSFSIDDLMRIAVAASYKAATLKIYNVNHFSTDELVRLSVAGKGCIEFIETK